MEGYRKPKVVKRSRNRIGRHRELLAATIWSHEHWSESFNTEIWLNNPTEIKKFLDDLAKASMQLADEEIMEAEVKWRSTPREDDYSGDAGATKL